MPLAQQLHTSAEKFVLYQNKCAVVWPLAQQLHTSAACDKVMGKFDMTSPTKLSLYHNDREYMKKTVHSAYLRTADFQATY